MSLKDQLNFENTGNVLDIFGVSRARGEEIFNKTKQLVKKEFDRDDDVFIASRYLKQCIELATDENEERYCLYTAAEMLGQVRQQMKNPLAAFFAQL